MNSESANNCEKESTKRWHGQKIIGGLLSVMGFFWLAHKLDWLPAHGGPSIFWPMVVIVAGLFMLFGRGCQGKKHAV